LYVMIASLAVIAAGDALAISVSIVEVDISNISISPGGGITAGQARSTSRIPFGTVQEQIVNGYLSNSSALLDETHNRATTSTSSSGVQMSMRAMAVSDSIFARINAFTVSNAYTFQRYIKPAGDGTMTVSFDYDIYRSLASQPLQFESALTTGFLRIRVNPNISGSAVFTEMVSLDLSNNGSSMPGASDSGTLSITLPALGLSEAQVEIEGFVTAEAHSGLDGTLFGGAGGLVGAVPSSPLLANSMVNATTHAFNVEVGVVGQLTPVFIDPEVALGYEYSVGTGEPQFTGVLLPSDIGDGVYDILVPNSGGGTDRVAGVLGGDLYEFSAPVPNFRVVGIEADANLDPTDPTAFVTGLTFDNMGTANVLMRAITVPEPGSIWILACATLGMGRICRGG
ncbi:MAG: hypothetical protein ACR2NU_05700, partial [Aeoliella sp.]